MQFLWPPYIPRSVNNHEIVDLHVLPFSHPAHIRSQYRPDRLEQKGRYSLVNYCYYSATYVLITISVSPYNIV